jgi:hypothetical protein
MNGWRSAALLLVGVGAAACNDVVDAITTRVRAQLQFDLHPAPAELESRDAVCESLSR